MRAYKNSFKAALTAKRTQFGLWLGMANAYSAEMIASVGFDWLLIDGEHAPNDLQSILHQLQAIAPYQSQPIVRLPVGNEVLIKQVLDLGVQTILVPMVETAQQAQELVKAMHYPPQGIRGVGSALARASRWNQVDNYLSQAGQELSLLVQVETLKGLENLAQIAAVAGVDGVFIGPADLSASMGFLANPTQPEVQKAIEEAFKVIQANNKAVGILFADEKYLKRYVQLGCNFVAIGVDTSILVNSCHKLLKQYKGENETPNESAKAPSVY